MHLLRELSVSPLFIDSKARPVSAESQDQARHTHK